VRFFKAIIGLWVVETCALFATAMVQSRMIISAPTHRTTSAIQRDLPASGACERSLERVATSAVGLLSIVSR